MHIRDLCEHLYTPIHSQCAVLCRSFWCVCCCAFPYSCQFRFDFVIVIFDVKPRLCAHVQEFVFRLHLVNRCCVGNAESGRNVFMPFFWHEHELNDSCPGIEVRAQFDIQRSAWILDWHCGAIFWTLSIMYAFECARFRINLWHPKLPWLDLIFFGQNSEFKNIEIKNILKTYWKENISFFQLYHSKVSKMHIGRYKSTILNKHEIKIKNIYVWILLLHYTSTDEYYFLFFW